MNILLTSAGRRSYIVDYFKQCEGVGKVYASNSEYSIALQKSDGYFISPLIYSEDYIPSIIRFCKENNVKVILSLFDVDLLVLAQHEKEFNQNGIELILAPEQFVRICNDKFATYQFLRDLGILTPLTYKNIEDVKSALINKEISFPIIMKPRWGMASMSIYKIYNDEELEVLTKRCNREIFESHLKSESNQTPDEAIIYQQLIKGKEYGLDVLNSLDGEYISTFSKRKVTMRSGETDLGRTVDPVLFENIAKKISKVSCHHGILSVDCIQDEKGIFVIEMNCRISGHYPLAYIAGFNYPQIVIDWMNGKPINPENLKFKIGMDIVKDLVPTVLSP